MRSFSRVVDGVTFEIEPTRSFLRVVEGGGAGDQQTPLEIEQVYSFSRGVEGGGTGDQQNPLENEHTCSFSRVIEVVVRVVEGGGRTTTAVEIERVGSFSRVVDGVGAGPCSC